MDYKRNTALDYAIQNKFIEIETLLLEIPEISLNVK